MWAEIIGEVVKGAGELAAGRLAPPSDPNVWIPDAADVAGISRPLGRLAGRRLSFGEKAADYGDGIAAGLAFASYVIKNVVRSVNVAATARRGARLSVAPDGPASMPPDVAAAYARLAAEETNQRAAGATPAPPPFTPAQPFAPSGL